MIVTDINDMTNRKMSFQVRVPANSIELYQPITLEYDHYKIQGAYIDRGKHEIMPDQWNDYRGFYILLSPQDVDGKFQVYVGETSNNFKNRLKDHAKNKHYWIAALLIHKEGLTSTEIRFLEGQMVDLFSKYPEQVHVWNEKPTGDRTLREESLDHMEDIIQVSLSMMELRGYTLTARQNSRFLQKASSLQEAPVQIKKLPPRPILAATAPPISVESYDAHGNFTLEDKLRTWRKKKSKSLNNLHQGFIISNAIIANIVQNLPQDEDELLRIPDMTKEKMTKYGKDILAVIHSMS